jgi:LCP family protein required for cell wall assembly
MFKESWIDDMTKKKRRINKPLIIFTIINALFTLLLTIFILLLNIIPIKYLLFIITLLILINTICFIFIKNKRKVLKIIGYVISVILIIVSTIGSYYLYKTNKFLDKAFNNATNSYTNTYYVLILNDASYDSIEDIENETLGYYTNIPNINEALDKLSEKVDTDNKEYEEILELYQDLDNKKIDATIIESSLYLALTEESNIIDKDKYKILYEFDIEIEEEVEEIVDDGNNINIYIVGADFTGKNNDFNMVVTINKKTHKIVLTSIPRDYYVTVSGTGMKDLLGYAGYTGINTSRKTVENLFGINIDYYIKINTSSLVGLVDVLGGVEFCSDTSFTTTHALVTNTYDDTTGQKLNVTKGCKTYSGIEILTIARERNAYSDRDRQRQKNCQQIMINIFKKMTNAENITNYSNILNAVSDLYTTNISRDIVTELAKDTIDNGVNWEFIQQSVTGRDSSGYVHLGTVKDYVMIPDQDSLSEAISQIKTVMSGK